MQKKRGKTNAQVGINNQNGEIRDKIYPVDDNSWMYVLNEAFQVHFCAKYALSCYFVSVANRIPSNSQDIFKMFFFFFRNTRNHGPRNNEIEALSCEKKM